MSKESNPDIPFMATLTPIQLPFQLRYGVNTESAEYRQLINDISDNINDIVDAAVHFQSTEYSELSSDVKSLRMFVWQPQHWLRFHVFPNGVAIVEHVQPLHSDDTVKALEEKAQALSEQVIQEQWPTFIEISKSLIKLNQNLIQMVGDDSLNTFPLQIKWITRCLCLKKPDLTSSTWQRNLTQWLANTRSPADAQLLCDGKLNHSMTWLNYVVVDVQQNATGLMYDYRFDSMILAQYFYTAQENCNQQLKQAIEKAYIADDLLTAEKTLSKARLAARMQTIQYHDALKYVTRDKREKIAEILNGWDYSELVENSNRMIDVCSSRLEEVDNRRREKSSVMTDLLLVALSFFAVFELSLYLVELSREMMSRPTLDYHDDSSSVFLSFIANIDTDYMFSFGVLVTVALFFIYRKFKQS